VRWNFEHNRKKMQLWSLKERKICCFDPKIDFAPDWKQQDMCGLGYIWEKGPFSAVSMDKRAQTNFGTIPAEDSNLPLDRHYLSFFLHLTFQHQSDFWRVKHFSWASRTCPSKNRNREGNSKRRGRNVLWGATPNNTVNHCPPHPGSRPVVVLGLPKGGCPNFIKWNTSPWGFVGMGSGVGQLT